MAASTAGVANGFVQGNLAILPEKLAASFHRFCQLNPKAMPDHRHVRCRRSPHSLARDRSRYPHRRAALSGLARRRGGGGADRHHGALARRSGRLRARLLVFVRGSADGGRSADPPHRAQCPRADVPHQHRLQPVGAVRRSDGGVDAAVQAGGCDPRGADHLAISRRARRAGASRPSPFDRDRGYRQARLRRRRAGGSRRDSGVLGLRRDAASGDRGGETAVCHHACAGIDAGDGPARTSNSPCFNGQLLPFFEALPAPRNRFIDSKAINRGYRDDHHSPKCIAWSHRHRRADADRGPRADTRSGDRHHLSVLRRQRTDRRRCPEVVRDRGRDHQQQIRFRSAAGPHRGIARSRRRQGPAGVRRPPGRSAEGPRRSRAPDHAGKGLRHHRHLSERGRGHGQPDLRALPNSVHLGRQFLAEPASPRPQILFPRRPA